ncbi:PhoH family protein, partial [Candidatus Woesearchaeota archaeon]|nr:PhoH family protein [Candidatus Woesearchaeota archaeon]
NTVLVFDEVQNYLPDVVQTITSRQDSGTKIIICGDPYGQIDNPRCTPEFNGLTHALKYFRGEPYVAAVHLHRSHRGAVARHAANWRPPQR